MASGQRRLDLVVGNEAAFLEIDEKHFAWLQPPFGDDVFLRYRQHANFRSHDDPVVFGDDVTCGAQPVAVQRRANLTAVGESDGGGAVPRLHERGIVFVEVAAFLVHERIARPCFGNHHHHRMRERIAAHGEEFERVIETRGVGLSFVGDRPQLLDVIAEVRRRHRSLPRRHPVVVAAKRVDLTVMRDHAVRVRQRPGRERVRREALMHQGKRALKVGVAQIRVIGAELVGEEHAFVDHRAARDRNRIIVRSLPLAAGIKPLRDRLAQDVKPPLELGFRPNPGAAGEKDLLVDRLGRLDQFTESGVVGRHVAPAEQRHTFLLGDLDVGLHNFSPPFGIVREEQRAYRVMAGLRQFEAQFGGFLGKKFVRLLHQNACAIAGARIGADGAPVLEVDQNGEGVLDDPMRGATLDIGNEADTAGIFLQRRIEQAETRGAHGRLALPTSTPTVPGRSSGIMRPAQDRVFRRRGRATAF